MWRLWKTCTTLVQALMIMVMNEKSVLPQLRPLVTTVTLSVGAVRGHGVHSVSIVPKLMRFAVEWTMVDAQLRQKNGFGDWRRKSERLRWTRGEFDH
ncbi:hypothetical protein RRG08_054059 [Elysia crispata]|uniref:Uncharacterized protein n=1 Tax=Elysia crispata TaxID=231223 RepID=A0AAE1DDX8_9GAST|nr:hypothetical protein RRG08_054059 [Elysia crispata]